MQFTIHDLLEKYIVTVPQLQRDYAQGRISETELRKSFISKIKQVLTEETKALNLDFIYGYTKTSGPDRKAFIPLDGQQRLTTLWLLLWFLSPRENNQLSDDVKKILLNFTYETRISSKRFCTNLVSQPLPIIDDVPFSEQIVDAPWFIASWINDPTVISMLNMLDTLQAEFNEKEIAWKYLIENKKITFDYIDIKAEEFKLTDELYIKMNSRGKLLTPFENFKAQFSTLLSSNTTNYSQLKLKYEGVGVSYQQYFAFKIDSVWMDLFWNYRNKVSTNTDECIYQFINYIAEFLYYKDNPKTLSSDVNIDFDFLNSIFSVKKNIIFLFNSLDILSELKDIKEFFNKLFEKLSTFDDYDSDYFLRAISNDGFDVKDKVIFYTVLLYCSKYSKKQVDEELIDLVRIVRNLLLTVRQPNQYKRIEFSSNLRLPNVSEYCNFIDALIDTKAKEESKSFYQILAKNEFSGFTKDNIQNEKIKAGTIVSTPQLKLSILSLEEHNQIQGNTCNFKLSSSDIENKIKAFLEIWSEDVDNSILVRSLLAINDYSVRTHSYSALGEIWYFGCKGSWNRILTSINPDSKTDFSDTLDMFLTLYLKTKGNSPIEKLNTIVANYRTDFRDWRYYFIKYDPITRNNYLTNNVFTWGDDNGFDINSIGNSGNYPLHSYHLNPYLITIKHFFHSNKSVILYWGRFADVSYIKIQNCVNIYANKKGWIITPIDDYKIDKTIIKNYNLNKETNRFILEETKQKDKIEIALDFINDILK